MHAQIHTTYMHLYEQIQEYRITLLNFQWHFNTPLVKYKGYQYYTCGP